MTKGSCEGTTRPLPQGSLFGSAPPLEKPSPSGHSLGDPSTGEHTRLRSEEGLTGNAILKNISEANPAFLILCNHTARDLNLERIPWSQKKHYKDWWLLGIRLLLQSEAQTTSLRSLWWLELTVRRECTRAPV